MSTFCFRKVDTNAAIFYLQSVCLVESGCSIADFRIVDKAVSTKSARLCIVHHVDFLDWTVALEDVSNFTFGCANMQAEDAENCRRILKYESWHKQESTTPFE